MRETRCIEKHLVASTNHLPPKNTIDGRNILFNSRPFSTKTILALAMMTFQIACIFLWLEDIFPNRKIRVNLLDLWHAVFSDVFQQIWKRPFAKVHDSSTVCFFQWFQNRKLCWKCTDWKRIFERFPNRHRPFHSYLRLEHLPPGWRFIGIIVMSSTSFWEVSNLFGRDAHRLLQVVGPQCDRRRCFPLHLLRPGCRFAPEVSDSLHFLFRSLTCVLRLSSNWGSRDQHHLDWKSMQRFFLRFFLSLTHWNTSQAPWNASALLPEWPPKRGDRAVLRSSRMLILDEAFSGMHWEVDVVEFDSPAALLSQPDSHFGVPC